MASGVLMATNISSKQQKERKFLKKSASLDDMIDEKKVKEKSMESKSKSSKSESEESTLKDKKHKSSTKKPNSAMTARGTVKLKDEKRSKFSFSLFGGLTFSKPKVKQRTVLSPAVTRKTNDVINTLGNSKSNPKQKGTRTRSKSKDRGSIIESHTSGTSSRSHTKPRERTALGTYKEKIKTRENSKERSKHGVNGNKSPSISCYQGKRSHMPLPPIPQLPEVLEEDSEEFHSALGLALGRFCFIFWHGT
ncbi:unnamed protein product [Owenia fusiformis]|uniref:Uncharacterized protein n=1 Tax=Owenia fusiformis TaxID=6347 RepID=A0A8J1U7I8_OWEFU|nr:unnamed protein product [Owenia fusiformis]